MSPATSIAARWWPYGKNTPAMWPAMNPPDAGGIPARSRARSSAQVNGQLRWAATISTIHPAHATWSRISRGHRQARKPPNTPKARNA